jgi:type VI secretion system protein ImpG
VPDERVVDPMMLPRGSLLRAALPDGRPAIFSTERALRVLPLKGIERVALEQGRRGLSLVIRVAARAPLRGGEEIELYVRRLADYRASLSLLDALERHVVRASAVFDPDERGGPGEPGKELSCGLRFGAPAPSLVDDELERGPLGRIRAFFHAPERDLFLGVRLPSPGRPFRSVVLRFELDEGWPEDLSPTRDNFALFVVPVVNQWVETAEPIVCDGTRDAYPIRSAAATLDGVRLVAARAVYEVGDKGLSPILPASLARGGDAWDVEGIEEGAPRLLIQLAGAFTKPRKLSVDGLWSQPALWASAPGQVKLALRQRHLAGVGFRLLGELRGPAPSPLAKDPERVVDVLARRARPIASARDLAGVLEILGASGQSVYRELPGTIAGLSLREAPEVARPGGGIKHVYTVTLGPRPPEDAPLVRAFAARIGALLGAWTEGAVEVEIAASAPAARAARLEAGRDVR